MRLLFCLILMMLPNVLKAAPDIWGLVPQLSAEGPYRPGFQSFVVEDPWHRNQNLVWKKPQRQVLINIWYPTAATASNVIFRHQDYFQSTDPDLQTYLTNYQNYLLGSLYRQNNGRTITPQLTPLPRTMSTPPLPLAFSRPTNVLRDAPLAKASTKPFPLIFYNTGNKGGFDENAPLFEFLASHGFVIAEAVSSDAAGSLDQSSRETSWAGSDQSLALTAIQAKFPGQGQKIILLGHSGGAQKSLELALSGLDLAGVILLDTTLEGQAFHNFDVDILKQLKSDRHRVQAPLLILSQLDKSLIKDRFAIYRSLPHASRILVDFGAGVEHDDFTWHGSLFRAEKGQLTDAVRKTYQTSADFILAFLQDCALASCSRSIPQVAALSKKNSQIFFDFWPAAPSALRTSELRMLLRNGTADDIASLHGLFKSGRLMPDMVRDTLEALQLEDAAAEAQKLCAHTPEKSHFLNSALLCCSMTYRAGDLNAAASYCRMYLKKKIKKPTPWEQMDQHDARTLLKMIEEG
ncbi:MAG TPA: hypothetical protein VE954_14980 [Oligoflexus sp.]|uniref:hypothetical protein n=1 Tax=Oligoflexus sp. TaxID=1971216 RepID=UPI002D23FAA7|nr:hypothetical protein [Oligoflexus sp.]HYX34406.1 hypothetical protein [Oligoflexus sp.]